MEPAQDDQGRQDPPQKPCLLYERDHDFFSTNSRASASGFRLFTMKVSQWPDFEKDYTT
jgi:hypothetical protein